MSLTQMNDRDKRKYRAIFKFNGGHPVLLCTSCYKIIKYSQDFNEEEVASMRGEAELKSQYCEECKKKALS